MASIARSGDLEINQDLGWQQRTWRAERIGWIVMALLLIAAFVGVFGGGPLSSATATAEPDLLSVEYPRFGRLKAPAELRIRVGGPAVAGDPLQIWIDRALADDIHIEVVVPEPERVEAGPDRLIYHVPVATPGQPVGITFFVRPENVGPLTGRVGVVGGPELQFSPFIYP